MNYKSLRKIRIQAGVTATEIVKRSRIAPSRISLFEHGIADLSDVQLEAFRRGLIAAIESKLNLMNTAIQKLKSLDEKSGIGASIAENSSCLE